MGQYWPNMISLLLVLSMAILLNLQSSRAHDGNTPDDYVHAHSCIRRVLGMPPLKWDPELAKVAQAYAEERKDCAMIHSTTPYGENLSMGAGLNGSFAVQMWLDERLDYDYSTNECIKMCGHYTQIVWRNSERLGCGRSLCDDGVCYIVVCNYDPPGNVVGQKPY